METHAFTFSVVLGRMPAPTVARSPYSVRFGPSKPSETPCIAWQVAHWARNTRSPASSAVPAAGASGSAFMLATHRSKSACESTCTRKRISACADPQNSAHCP